MSHALASLLVLASLASSSDELRMTVVDASGEPVDGARACLSGWEFPAPESEAESAPAPVPMYGVPSASSDAQGSMVLTTRGMAGTRTLVALHWERGLGAVRVIPEIRDAGELRLELVPLVELKGELRVTVPGGAAPEVTVWLNDADTHFPLAACRTRSSFAFHVPPGRYTLSHQRGDRENAPQTGFHGPLLVRTGASALDLGAFDLELARLVEIRGRVVDAGGAPLAQASLATTWIVDTARGERIQPFTGVHTADDGTFVLQEEVYDPSAAVLVAAYDAARERGVLLSVMPAEQHDPLELRLQPVVTVRGRLVLDDGKAPPWTNVYVSTEDGRRFAECRSEEGRLVLGLPPGRYALRAYGTDTEQVSLPLVLEPGTGEVDLGAIRLASELHSTLVGKAAPAWNVTAARGLEPSVSVSDFRGRWLLVEFWGYW